MPLARIPWPTFLFLFLVLIYVCPFSVTYTAQVGGSTSGAEGLAQRIEEGNLLRQTALAVITIWSLIVVWSTRIRHLQLRRGVGYFILVYLAWIVLSPLWSNDVNFTIRKVVALLMFCSGALAVATRCSWRDIVAFTLFNSFVILAISVFVEVWFGAFRPWQFDYRFSGVMHPNSQGANCTILLISAVAYSSMARKGRSVLYAIAVIALLFLLLTKSRTAAAAGVLSAILCLTLVTPKLRYLIVSVCFSGAALSILLAVLSLIGGSDSTVSLISLGREDTDASTLSGRVPLWMYLLDEVERKPLTGYGYGSFWTPDRVIEATSEQGWVIGSTHSGYFAIALCLGIPGLIMLIAVLGSGIYESLRTYTKTKMPGPAFAASILIFMALSMFFEEIIDKLTYITFISFIVLARIAFVRERFETVKAV